MLTWERPAWNPDAWRWTEEIAIGSVPPPDWTPAERAALEVLRLRYELHLLHEETLDHLRLIFARWLYERGRLTDGQDHAASACTNMEQAA